MSYSRYIACLATLLMIVGCSGTKDKLGLTRKAPDEFAVVKRAPLELPPDYSLRPPRPGAARPQEAAPEEKAKEVVFGRESTEKVTTASSAESVLLQKTGATSADPTIRQVVDKETSELAPAEKPVTERLLGWTRGGNKEEAATVVDPIKEAERLRTNQESGLSPTDGETPSIEQ